MYMDKIISLKLCVVIAGGSKRLIQSVKAKALESIILLGSSGRRETVNTRQPSISICEGLVRCDLLNYQLCVKCLLVSFEIFLSHTGQGRFKRSNSVTAAVQADLEFEDFPLMEDKGLQFGGGFHRHSEPSTPTQYGAVRTVRTQGLFSYRADYRHPIGASESPSASPEPWLEPSPREPIATVAVTVDTAPTNRFGKSVALLQEGRKLVQCNCCTQRRKRWRDGAKSWRERRKRMICQRKVS